MTTGVYAILVTVLAVASAVGLCALGVGLARTIEAVLRWAH